MPGRTKKVRRRKPCKRCGFEFEVTPKRGTFCSQECSRESYKRYGRK
jgi:hypothetical protein